MNIRTFKIFTLDRILIYLGACFAFPLVVFGQAVRYNYFQHHTSLPVGGWCAMVAAMLTFAIGDFMLFWDRYKFSKLITGYTSDGLMVLGPNYKCAIPAENDLEKDLEVATKEVVDFWKVKYPNSVGAMEDLINGAVLGFTAQKIELLSHPPLSSVVTPGKVAKFAVGITSGNSMLVMAQPTETWENAVAARYKHELGHVCLNAAGVLQDGDFQHKIMNEAGFPY